MGRALRGLLVAAGAAGFLWLLVHTGFQKLWEAAGAVGVGAFLFAAVGGLEHLSHAWGWQRCFAREHAPRLGTLFQAYLAGYAFGLVTPATSVGGDVLRASLLPRNVPAAEAAASVTADRLACSVSDACLGLAGVAILLLRGPLGGWERLALVAATLLFGLGIGGFFLAQRSGRLGKWLIQDRLVRRLGGEHLASRLVRAGEDMDFRLRSLHLERPEAFRGAFARNLMASLVGGLQIALLLVWLGEPRVVQGALEIFLVGVALDIFSFFVPGRLGVQEASRMLGASVAGLDPSLGLLLSLLLRLEQLIWAGIGLALHSRLAAIRRPEREPV